MNREKINSHLFNLGEANYHLKRLKEKYTSVLPDTDHETIITCENGNQVNCIGEMLDDLGEGQSVYSSFEERMHDAISEGLLCDGCKNLLKYRESRKIWKQKRGVAIATLSRAGAWLFNKTKS